MASDSSGNWMRGPLAPCRTHRRTPWLVAANWVQLCTLLLNVWNTYRSLQCHMVVDAHWVKCGAGTREIFQMEPILTNHRPTVSDFCVTESNRIFVLKNKCKWMPGMHANCFARGKWSKHGLFIHIIALKVEWKGEFWRTLARGEPVDSRGAS